jgi:hypothetical protein
MGICSYLAAVYGVRMVYYHMDNYVAPVHRLAGLAQVRQGGNVLVVVWYIEGSGAGDAVREREQCISSML